MLTTSNEKIIFERGHLSDEKLLELYQLLLKPRMVEEKMLLLLRQGKVKMVLRHRAGSNFGGGDGSAVGG